MGTTASGFIYPDTGYTSGVRQAIEDLADSAEDVIREAGTPRFANAAARDAAITAPVLGMKAVLTSDEITYRYSGSAWVAWESAPISLAPTITGVTTSASAQTYTYINSNILVNGDCTVSAAPSGAVTIATPVAVAAPSANESVVLGHVKFVDTGTTAYTGIVDQIAANLVRVLVSNAASTYLAVNNLSSTVPHTWASGDRIKWRYWLTKDQF